MPPSVLRCRHCQAELPAHAVFCGACGQLQPRPDRTDGPRTEDPYLGRVLAGRWELLEPIGMGATGRVYRARDRTLGGNVAVKVLHRTLARDPEIVARFHREADVVRRLRHPNVVELLEVGSSPAGNGDRPGESAPEDLYLVMELLGRASLRTVLDDDCARRRPGDDLPLARALRVLLRICDAVGEAHRHDVVHRDIKPENVMLVKRGADPDFVKMLDFGMARLIAPDRTQLTQTGQVFGSAPYVSPEGAEGAPVEPAGDVYAIAVLLYEWLAGRTPFAHKNPLALLCAKIGADPPPIDDQPLARGLPAPLGEVVMANLSRDPAGRDRDATALGQRLLDAARASKLDVAALDVPGRFR